MAQLPAWDYTGPLEPAIQYVRARHTEVVVYSDDDVHYVSSKHGGGSISTSADSEEEAWRGHLGQVLTKGSLSPTMRGRARPSPTSRPAWISGNRLIAWEPGQDPPCRSRGSRAANRHYGAA